MSFSAERHCVQPRRRDEISPAQAEMSLWTKRGFSRRCFRHYRLEPRRREGSVVVGRALTPQPSRFINAGVAGGVGVAADTTPMGDAPSTSA